MNIRHNWVRDALATWLTEQGKSPVKEQEIPAWNITGTGGERAILDLVYQDQQWGRVAVDVTVVDSETSPGGPRTAHLALARREATKHRKYPGPGLVPFVLDTRGKWGAEAQAWVFSVVRHMSGQEKAEALIRCRLLISMALQRGVAEQIISANRDADNTGTANTAANARAAASAATTGSAASSGAP